ncbi:globin-like protein [Chlamydoabsidia padenii]|nr:globin-like protein [Chlamydoabsidia padenii]
MSTPTRQQIDQVRQVWERVCERRHRKDHPSVSSAHAFGLVFYKVLFEMDPSLKFKLGNVIRQARMLAEIMSYLTRSPSIKGETGSLKDLNALIVQQQEENKWFAYKLREVGIQHVEEYDLVPENLEVFTPSLIAALKSRLQDEFSPEMEQAWVKVSDMIQSCILN